MPTGARTHIPVQELIAILNSQLEMSTPKAVWTNDIGSMAEDTARTRWPLTVQNMVDDVNETLQGSLSEEERKEGLGLVAALQALKQDIIDNKAIK